MNRFFVECAGCGVRWFDTRGKAEAYARRMSDNGIECIVGERRE